MISAYIVEFLVDALLEACGVALVQRLVLAVQVLVHGHIHAEEVRLDINRTLREMCVYVCTG